MKTVFLRPKQIERKWCLIDAEGIPLGKVATKAAVLLRGKDKPYYAPHQEMGDFLVIINAEKVLLTGDKKQKKLYYRHSGYPGGLRVDTYETLLKRCPTLPVQKAVARMLPKGRLGRRLFRNLRVYRGSEHLHEAQKPEKVGV